MSYSILAPGPVNLHPQVQTALSQPMKHHRTPEVEKLIRDCLNGLQDVFQTKQPVMMTSSTGSGGMEACLVNLLSPGDTVICVNSGKFGERWRDMALAFGVQVEEIQVEWGQAVTLDQIKKAVAKVPNAKALLTQACETSTGVFHPIKEIGEFLKTTSTLFLVDGITAVGASDLKMDEWHIDALVAGSQKAFMIPAGLAFVAFSKEAWKAYETSSCPKYYWDLGPELSANKKNQTRMSSSVTLLYALAAVLPLMTGENRLSHLKRIKTLSQATHRFAELIGLCSYSLSPSTSLSILALPKEIDGSDLRARIEKQHKVTFMGGQDQLKGQVIRIGHMGYITDDMMKQGLKHLAVELMIMGHQLHTDQIDQALNEVSAILQKAPLNA